MLDNSYSLKSSSQNVRKSGIAVDSWQYTNFYEILKNIWNILFFNIEILNHYINIKSRVDLKFLPARNWVLLWERLCTHFDHVYEVEAKKNVRIIVFQIICYSIDYGKSDPLFSHLWILLRLSSWFKRKQGTHICIFNYILPFSYKSGMAQLFTISTVNFYLNYFTSIVLC